MENDFGTVGALRELIAGFKKANELLKAKKVSSEKPYC